MLEKTSLLLEESNLANNVNLENKNNDRKMFNITNLKSNKTSLDKRLLNNNLYYRNKLNHSK